MNFTHFGTRIARNLATHMRSAGTPIEHLMVHFSEDDVKGIMEAGK